MKRAEKISMTDDLRETFEKANAVFISDYRSIPMNKLTELRFELNKTGSKFKIIKNRMALRAMKEEQAKELESKVDDMTAFTITQGGDPAATAKALTSFAKKNENLKLRAALLDGKVISLEDIRALSDLPSREELLAKLLGVLSAVPGGFVRVLNAVPSGWVNVLDALKRQKEEKGES